MVFFFFNLKDSRTNMKEDICPKFFKQYRYNNEVDVIRRDLETTKQDARRFSCLLLQDGGQKPSK